MSIFVIYMMNKLLFYDVLMIFNRPVSLVRFFFMMLALWNNSPQVYNMSLHLDTLYWLSKPVFALTPKCCVLLKEEKE